MTAAKPAHVEARRLLLQHLDLHPGRTVPEDLDPLEVGIVGDTAHQEGGDSYHLGADQIRARNGRDRYSVDESVRDQRGLDNYASALDIGYFKVKTPRGTFDLYDFNAWLIGLCTAGDPDTTDLREVIYTPDGKTVRRWDRLRRRSSGDNSHLSHTHLSEHRDATGKRMVRLASRWLQHIGLIEEDNMPLTSADVEKIWETDGIVSAPANSSTVGTNPFWAPKSFLTDTASHVRSIYALLQQVAAKVGADPVDEQAIIQGVLAGLPASAIAAAIPKGMAAEVVSEVLAKLPKANADEILRRLQA